MTVLPVAIAVTTPALETVATAVLDEVQGLTAAGVPEPLSVMVEPIHKAGGPEMVGLGLTVMVVVFEHPALLV